MRRFRKLLVLKIISSTISFSIMGQEGGFASRNIFFRVRVSQGLSNLISNVLMTKLKKVLRLAYRIRLVVCFLTFGEIVQK
jgi:hypothetical protein